MEKKDQQKENTKIIYMLPIAPESINETVAFGSRYSDIRLIKRRWQHLTISHLMSQSLDTPFLIPKTPIDEKVKVTFSFYFLYERLRDEDNYSLSAKGILDGLVEMGILFSDSDAFVTFGGIRLLKDSRPRVEVEIELLKTSIDFSRTDQVIEDKRQGERDRKNKSYQKNKGKKSDLLEEMLSEDE